MLLPGTTLLDGIGGTTLLDGIGGALVRAGTLPAATEPPELAGGMLVVSVTVLAALVPFVREPISLDVTVIAVTFAASMAFMTPMGTRRTAWRTGRGVRFVDYTRAGAPLQRLLAVVTVVGIWGIWGVRPGDPSGKHFHAEKYLSEIERNSYNSSVRGHQPWLMVI